MRASCPVRWGGQSAIITLPAEMDINNAGQVSVAALAAGEPRPGNAAG